MARPVALIVGVLCVLNGVCPFDLVSTLLSHGSSSVPGLKSLVSPEMLTKMKDALSGGSGNAADMDQMERIIAKLKPAEGRFDPAMLELLASMDANRANPRSTPRSVRHSKPTSKVPRLEVLSFPDDSMTLPSATTEGLTTTTEGRPKFSSKFRLHTDKEEETTSPMLLDHVISDPNLRNHRLYDVDQEERYENYENFTTIDQLEDLIAEESNPPQVVVTIATKKAQKKNHGPRGKVWATKRKNIDAAIPTSTTSFEELVSMETTEENDSMARERAALKHSSTEKTLIYSQPMTTGSSSDGTYMDETTAGFRPSPVDPAASAYFQGEEFYAAKRNKPKMKLKRPRRPQHHHHQHQQQRPNNVHNNKYDDSYHYHDDEDYEKEQPDYQNVVNYLKLQGQGPTSNVRSTTPRARTPSSHGHFKEQPTPQPSDHHPLLSPQSASRQSYRNSVLNPHLKQDRILTPADVMQPVHVAAASQPHPIVYPDQYNRYIQSASENVYNDVHGNLYPAYYAQPSTDTTYSAGQNYYQSSYAHGQGHQGGGHVQDQSHASGYGAHQIVGGHDQSYAGSYGGSQNYGQYEGHYPHHVEESSSWSSTFLILGGLIALSAAIAFLMPSFITGAGTTGGKDGVDKNANTDTDLWTEIKGLYNDLFSIARGDYSHFNRYRDQEQSLPKINIVYSDPDETTTTTAVGDDGSHHSNNVSKRMGESEASSEENNENVSTSVPGEHDEDRVRRRPDKKRRIVDKDTLAFGVPGNAVPQTKNHFDFANAFNQTLHAWEKVPLITN